MYLSLYKATSTKTQSIGRACENEVGNLKGDKSEACLAECWETFIPHQARAAQSSSRVLLGHDMQWSQFGHHFCYILDD